MKPIWCIVCCLLLSFATRAQHACCIKAVDDFAALGKNKDFRMEHTEPLPFAYEATRGNDITYSLPDGSTAHAFEIKASHPTDYYVFMIHEWWGLNDFVKQEAEKLSNELGVHVLALDLYDNKVTASREDAAKFMQAVDNQRAVNIIRGAYQYAGSKARVFTLGWCFGGGWSLQTALLGGSQVAGCVMYYGMPERDVEKLKNLQCDVIGFFAQKDQAITPEIVKAFEQSMQAAGKQVTIYMYDAVHAFANPSNPQFDKAARDDAYAKQIQFIKSRMKE